MLDNRTAVTRPLTIQVVTDGRTGIENQALGLAEAVARLTPARITVSRVGWQPLFDPLPARFKTPAMLAPGSDRPFAEPGAPWPDLWIATGRASLPLSIAARRRSGGKTFVVQTQNPRVSTDLFDLVIAPAHDQLSGDRVFEIIGAPHRITARRLADAAPAFAEAIASLPRPRVAILIGGKSSTYDLDDDHASQLANRIVGAVSEVRGSVIVTFSRRTPRSAAAILTLQLRALPGLIWDGQGDNPLFAFLETADHILVTEDSANMATEAAATGRPVHILPMTSRRSVNKFNLLHEALIGHGAARYFDGNLTYWTYEPLNETDRAARAILEAMAARG